MCAILSNIYLQYIMFTIKTVTRVERLTTDDGNDDGEGDASMTKPPKNHHHPIWHSGG